jgi:hypothetical protein
VQHKGGSDHRRDEIDERQGEQPCNHDPTQENAVGEPAVHRPGFPINTTLNCLGQQPLLHLQLICSKFSSHG